MQKNDQPITYGEFKKELKAELEIFGAQLAVTIITTLRKEFNTVLDRRFAESEARIINHVEDLMAEQSLEITTAVANMIQPIQQSSQNHEKRITHLEHKIA